ncbi:kinase-like domain-containing protein [Mycena olivaceomarginata]|nr:kinase-like domain-containing protein [Mycena olivaceomarginata]
MRVYGKYNVETLLKVTRSCQFTPLFGVYYLEGPIRRLCLVSPWMENGNISDYLERNPTGINRLTLLLDVVTGLEHLHGQRVVHGDLKAINVLVSRSGRAVLTDFGLSTVVMDSNIPGFSTTLESGGTLRWQAPELLKGDRNSVKSDVYAFAGVSYEIFTGKVPFFEFGERAILLHILSGNIPQKSSSISDDKRPTAKDIVARLGDRRIGATPTKAAADWDPSYTSRFRSSFQEHTLFLSCGKIEDWLQFNHTELGTEIQASG